MQETVPEVLESAFRAVEAAAQELLSAIERAGYSASEVPIYVALDEIAEEIAMSEEV
jgi:hypothetical protein